MGREDLFFCLKKKSENSKGFGGKSLIETRHTPVSLTIN
jgi:hypothetical protein